MIRPSCSCLLVGVLLECFIPTLATTAAESPRADYAAVEAVFSKHCLDCHAAQDPEAKLVLESYADFLKGGESGAVFVTNRSADSLLVKMVEGNFERDGKKKIMPPGKRKKLEASEIAALKGWIDAGAPSPKDTDRKSVV